MTEEEETIEELMDIVIEELDQQGIFVRRLDGDMYIIDGQVDLRELMRAILNP